MTRAATTGAGGANGADRNLDLLRALAVLCVVIDHTAVSQIGVKPWLWTLGRCGVLLFFVHTAYVLMASLDRSPERRRTTSFYLRRALRIYPLAIATVIIVAASAFPALPSVGTLMSNLLLVQNLTGRLDVVAPLWTLPLEVQMYVLLPLCYLIARRSAAQAIGLLALAALFGLWQLRVAPHDATRASLLQFGPCFMAGVAAWAIRRRFAGSRVLSASLWLPCLVATVVAFALLLHPDEQHIARGWPFCVVIGLLIVVVRELGTSWLTRLAHTVAEYSYGIYLWHVPALSIAFVWGREWPIMAQWAAYATLIALFPWLAYHAIERPGIALGKRIATEWARDRMDVSTRGVAALPQVRAMSGD